MKQLYALIHMWNSDFNKSASVIAVSSGKDELRKLMKDAVLAAKKETEDGCRNCSVTWQIVNMEENSFAVLATFPHFPGTYSDFRWTIQAVPVIENQEDVNEISSHFGPI